MRSRRHGRGQTPKQALSPCKPLSVTGGAPSAPNSRLRLFLMKSQRQMPRKEISVPPRTTFGTLGAGDRVNFEVDTIARYVARLLGKD